MRCHPILYLALLVALITTFNLFYITKVGKRAFKASAQRPTQEQVQLLVNDEHTILSRIRYPNRNACVLHGHLPTAQKPAKVVLGIASVARPPGVDYLSKTLHRVLESLAPEEQSQVVIVVAMTDKEKRLREERGKILYRKFKEQVDTGKVVIAAPSANIYPSSNFYALKRRPFNNSIERMEWQSKLSLDFAFLFSFCSPLAHFFMNLEDDVVPQKHFVSQALNYMQSKDEANVEWSSLQFSNYLSIGRFYRCSDLPRLVDLILISYRRMPVDFIMHHFDVLEMTDHFKEYRIQPPLLEHAGILSTMDVDSQRARVTKKYDAFKKSNPPLEKITTNMSQWENFQLQSTYTPGLGHFFWARNVHQGDVVDLTFKSRLALKAVYIVTGFDRDEDRAGNDRLLTGKLLVSRNLPCSQWTPVRASVDAWGKMTSNASRELSHSRCLRLQVVKTTSDWLVIRLIRVMLQ